ncbi:MAG TPA: hypothetical protein VGC22_00320 [Chitinophaga sp.]
MLTSLCLFACNKKDFRNGQTGEHLSRQSVQEKKKNLDKFAQIVAAAVTNSPALRSFIKQKALEQTDNDYDVIYNFVKDEPIGNGNTLREELLKYAAKDVFANLESSLPLVTIYVPKLPSGFNAETWDTRQQVPYVTSYTRKGQNRLVFYKNSTDTFSLALEQIPGFPALVVKNNERITLSNNNARQVTYKKQDFRFIDRSFDKALSPGATSARLANPTSSYSFKNGNMVVTGVPTGIPQDVIRRYLSGLSPQKGSGANAKYTATPFFVDTDTIILKNDSRLMTAYNVMGTDGTYWQRDNIYYGLTPTNTTGPLANNIYEYIYALRFSVDALNKMSDQAGDAAFNGDPDPGHGLNPPQSLFWFDGNFEFQIDILINDVSGIGSTVTKYITASPEDLYTVVYIILSGPVPVYNIWGVMPKYYYPELHGAALPLFAWDINNRSFSWKFSFSETDEQQTVATTETVTGQFATNFEFSAMWNTLAKIGLKFGASSTTTHTQTYTITSTLGADALGDITTNFGEPVMCPRDTSKHYLYPPDEYVEKLPYTYYEAKNPYVSMVLLPQTQF